MNTPTFKDLGGKTWELRRHTDLKEPGWSAFNPSISYSPVEGYAILFRSSNYVYNPKTGRFTPTEAGREKNIIENRLWFAYLSDDFELIESSLKEVYVTPWKIPMSRGIEDARLFWRETGWEFTATVYEKQFFVNPRIGRFKLKNYEATIINFYETCQKGAFQEVEKNWMPTDIPNEKFDYIYSKTMIYLDREGIVKVRSDLNIPIKLRGGSQLATLNSDNYLAVVHELGLKTINRFNPITMASTTDIRKYYHRFVRYTSDGALSGISDAFTFENDDIEFATGLIIDKNNVIISYGSNDVSSRLAKIKLEKVLEMIKDV